MPSVVDICNEALSHLGDSATVTSIDPPEGSAQAEHCARFYSTALASLTEMQAWSFTAKRSTLAYVSNPSSTWAYAYALPSQTVNVLSILASDATDDYSSTANINSPIGNYTPQPFAMETDASGSDILLTNQVDAVMRYTVLISDTTKFSPLFVECLAWLLASKLAGPVLKGDAGRAAAMSCMKMFQYWLGQATDSDSSQRKVAPRQQVAWMNAR